jgi:hypothetical protein
MLIYWVKVFTLQGKTEALLVISREIGLQVHAEKTKYIYMPMSREKNAGQNHNKQIGKISFERVW